MKWKIPVAKPDIGEEELKAVAEVVKSGWITQGEPVIKFEKEVSGVTTYARNRSDLLSGMNAGTSQV